MLKESALLLVLAVQLGLTEQFSCLANQSHIHHFSSSRVADSSWNLAAAIYPASDWKKRPFYFLMDASVQVKATRRFFEANEEVWQRLTLTFKCSGDNDVGTFVEITKNYAMFKIENQPIYRYCDEDEISRWSNIFTFYNENKKIF